MPIIPPSPAPSTPVAATGSNWIVSGGATSGNVSSADYAYYTQTAEWDYARKPRNINTWGNSTYGVNLQQVSAIQNVYGSYLHINAKFKTTCKKIKQQPAGGHYTQMQKFSIFTVVTDQYGFKYGDVPDSSAGVVFGPRGKVYTTQPWVWQLPWDDARDTEYDVITQGTSNGTSLSSVFWQNNGNDLGQEMDIYLPDSTNPQWGMPDLGSMTFAFGLDSYMMYGGGYALSSEIGFSSSSLGLDRMEDFIEDNCANLDNTSYRYRYVTPSPTNSDGYSWPQEADRVPRNPYYDTSRHDYS